MAFFGIFRVSRRLLRSSVSAIPSSSFAVLQLQHKSLSNPVTTHYTNPFTKCYPSWNYTYQVWSKGTELHQEKFLGVGWNYRLVGGMSSTSSVMEGKPKKDDKEKSDGGCVKEASWIDLYLPEEVRGYAKLARLDKPIGTWLLAWPCMWSIALTVDPVSFPSFKYMALFGYGALLLRGAGCTINDQLDQDIDTKVDRTRLRPIASGLLTPFQGIRFLGLQLL